MSYSAKLKDARWLARRQEIIAIANHKCEECGSPHMLQVHHEHYMHGKDPWEYEDDMLTCLCDECHRIRQGKLDAVHIGIARVLRSVRTRRLTALAFHCLSEGLKAAYLDDRHDSE